MPTRSRDGCGEAVGERGERAILLEQFERVSELAS